jgi:hypothetical protein
VLQNHIQDYKSCTSKIGTAYAGGQSFQELFYGMQPHIALQSAESEKEYCRRVGELLVDALLPEHVLQSEGVRLLIRELISNTVILSTIESLADPDFLNELLLKVSFILSRFLPQSLL